MALNRVDLIGNLGKDPEVRTTQEGKDIVTLTVATSEKWKDKSTGEQKEATEWHRVVIFSQGLATVAKTYLKKGQKVYVSGSLRTQKWTDKNGIDRYTTEIIMNGYGAKLEMLGSKDKKEQPPATEPEGPAPADDEIPF